MVVDHAAPRHVDLFAGPGGIATGFSAAGFHTQVAVEMIPSCVETYAHNHPNTPVLCADVRDVGSSELRSVGVESTDIVTAGIPCETFSTAGASSRSFYDHRQILFKEAIRIADLLKSTLILFENVPGLTSKRLSRESPKLVIEQIHEDLAESGYSWSQQFTLDASDYGVPQNRERFFIIASRSPFEFRLPAPVQQRTTVGQALFDLPVPLEPGSSLDTPQKALRVTNAYLKLMRNPTTWNRSPQRETISYHVAPRHRQPTIERFSYLEPGQGLKDLFDKFSGQELKELQKRRVLPKSWYIQRNRRLRADSQSPTVTSHCLDELVHPTQDRALTVREVARLQSFPDWYQFVGGPLICPHSDPRQDKYEQIGDAVPPLLARALGAAILEALNESNLGGQRERSRANSR